MDKVAFNIFIHSGKVKIILHNPKNSVKDVFAHVEFLNRYFLSVVAVSSLLCFVGLSTMMMAKVVSKFIYSLCHVLS